MIIKHGKLKRIKTGSKKFKAWTSTITISDFPKTLDVHVTWVHADAYDKEGILPAFGYADDIRNIPQEDWMFYRALMLEAGYVPTYFWKQEIPHPLTYMKPPKFNPKDIPRI